MNQTHFGYQHIDKNRKDEAIQGLFTKVSDGYDLMNDLMSLGLHRLWKDSLMTYLNLTPSLKILDLACGSGDVSLRIIEKLKSYPQYSNHITLCDLTPSMLEKAKEKLANQQKDNLHLSFIEGNAQDLPFADQSFDRIVISFGLRNVTDIDLALQQAYRCLKIGGSFTCLEFSMPEDSNLSRFYDFYSFQVIPKLGEWVLKDRDSYQYLVESIRKFPSKDKLREMMQQHKFQNIVFRPYAGGIVALHQGWRFA